jgi:type IV pilus assembly protein PilQ
MKKKALFLIIIVLSGMIFLHSQTTILPESKVTLLSETDLPTAFRAIEVLSQKEEGKKVINLSTEKSAIGFPINQVYWKDALHLIIKLYNLEMEELPGSFKISDKVLVKKEVPKVADVSIDSKQVKISATFFQTGKDFDKGIGIDWSTAFNGDVTARVDFTGTSAVASDLFKASAGTSIQNGNMRIDINTLFKVLESHEKGTTLARPTITVVSGKPGKVQVGSDFSVKMLDEAGNVTEQFFSTGLILNVTPTIIQENGIEAIHLKANVENSQVLPGTERTTIGKSSSNTDVLLFDGETTVIGGLFTTDVTTIRNGVPFLKDLPWWVLGIKYITGVNRQIKSEKEMVIVLKAEIVDTVQERIRKIIPIEENLEKHRQERREQIKIFDSLSIEK